MHSCKSIAIHALLVAITCSTHPHSASAFVPSPLFSHTHAIQSSFIQSTTQRSETSDTTNAIEDNANSQCRIPLTLETLISDASQTMTQAYEAGITRQTVRILLPRDANNAQLGQYFEEDAEVGGSSGTFGGKDMVLVPPDETWQGGIMQLYRAAAPTCREILR